MSDRKKQAVCLKPVFSGPPSSIVSMEENQEFESNMFLA
jgi:hypothetical protein